MRERVRQPREREHKKGKNVEGDLRFQKGDEGSNRKKTPRRLRPTTSEFTKSTRLKTVASPCPERNARERERARERDPEKDCRLALS
eukprot:scaffold633124_cov63-Attheya_sp.AAC.4